MQLLRLLPRFKEAFRAVDVLAQREAWSRLQIETYQLAKLNHIWQHAIERVPYYAALRQSRALPTEFGSLIEFTQRVPLLSKSVVRSSPERFLSSPALSGRWERTSGSTGAPTRVYHDVASHRVMQHAKYRLYQSWGVDILDRSAYLWSRADAVIPGWEKLLRKTRLHFLDTLRGRQRLSAFDLSPKTLRRHLREIEQFRPRILYGFSNAIYQLALVAADRGLVCDSLRAVVMTSEPATDRMQRTVATAFGVPVVLEYGATECELIAGLHPDGTLRVREDLVLVETLPAQPAGYEIVITVLTNPSFPLLRYQIEDVTTLPISLPEQGFGILPGGISGRRDDLLQTQNGGYLHPSAIDALFEHVVNSSAIRRYRIHQHRSGLVDVRIEVEADRNVATDSERLQAAISRLVEGFPVNIQLVTQLNTTVSAKHRAITSERTASMRNTGGP